MWQTDGLLSQKMQGKMRRVSEAELGRCHRYDFLVRLYWNGLNLFRTFQTFILHLGLITTPHVLYVHMTYVYSFFL